MAICYGEIFPACIGFLTTSAIGVGGKVVCAGDGFGGAMCDIKSGLRQLGKRIRDGWQVFVWHFAGYGRCAPLDTGYGIRDTRYGVWYMGYGSGKTEDQKTGNG